MARKAVAILGWLASRFPGGRLKNMETPSRPPASRAFLWAAVLAGLIPTLTLGGVALYMISLSIGISTVPGRGDFIPFLLTVSGFLSATLFAYWRVIWLYAQGRRPGLMSWFGSWLLMLGWVAWFAWGFVRTDGPGGSLGLLAALAPFVCWAIALKRTY